MKSFFTLMTFLLLSFVSFAQAETEPNDDYTTANTVVAGTAATGNVGASDPYDFFMAVLPEDGTVKIVVAGTNTGAGTGYLYLYTYDRRKAAGTISGDYIGTSSAVSGSTVNDTIYLYGRAADTVYFRLQATQAFSYSIKYTMVNTSPNDEEPNATFETALPVNELQAKVGHIGYLYNGTNDQYDYYRTVLPKDGTVKIYVEGINNSAGAGYLYLYTYDRRKAGGTISGDYVQGSSIASGSAVKDTFYLYGRAADTVYFRLQSTQPFSYGLKYEMVDTSTNDLEANDSYETSLPINELQVKKGHVGYLYNGTNDQNDYYSTVLPKDGTVKILMEGTNNSAGSGYLYLYTYDRRKAGGTVSGDYVGGSSVATGTSVKDTFYLYGRAADTVYFRLLSTQAFSYSLKYEMVDTSTNDTLSNETFETAEPIAHKEVKEGHIGYLSNGSNDQYDYYSTKLPSDGTLIVTVNGTNTSAGTGYLYLYIYDKRKASGNLAGNYIQTSSVGKGVSVTDTIKIECVAEDSVFFRLQSTQPFAYQISYEVTLGQDTTVKICPGEKTTLIGLYNTSPFNAVKYESMANPGPSIDASSVSVGLYRLSVINGTKECTRDTAFITVAPNPKPNLGADTIVKKCIGEKMDITNTKDTSGYAMVEWSTSTPSNLDTGVYTLIVTNTFGCKDTAVITVQNYPKPNLGKDTSVTIGCYNGTIDLYAVYDTTGYAGIAFDTNKPEAAGEGTYNIVVTNGNGCKDTAMITVRPFNIAIVPAAGTNSKFATRECTDSAGWTHYYNNNGTTATLADDILLLSIKKNSNNIGTIGDGSMQVKSVSAAGAGSGKGILITNTKLVAAEFWSMNRYWEIVPTTQPTAPVGVRFYYNTQDLADINGSHPSGNIRNQDLLLYKTINGSPDPTTNLAGADSIVKLMFGTDASLNTFTYHSLGNNMHYVEFMVSSFSGGGAGAVDGAKPLPLNLLAFTTAYANGNVSLGWKTAQEENVASFDVQRSTDGRIFETIGTVKAVGNGAHSYSYSDADAGLSQSGKLYYRLQIMDKNGAMYYSTIEAVSTGVATLVKISPNPAKNRVSIVANHMKQVQLLDSNGRVLIVNNINDQSMYTLQVGHLPTGLYLLKITTKDNQTHLEKLMIQ